MNLSEIIFKSSITIAVLGLFYLQFTFLKWLWPTQIDVKATCSRWFKQSSLQTDSIVARDPNKIYQNSNPVGDITGEVEEKENSIIFKQLSNTASLNRNMPFEYKRNIYKIKRIKNQIGLKIGVTNTGIDQKTGVLENVICEKLQ
jgi:hypothetical protein